VSAAGLKSDSAPGTLWRFSLDFYPRPGVAAACLALQDRHGRDVNLVLFAVWVGLSGRGRLNPAGLAGAEAAIGPWRGEMIEKLRELRRKAKSGGGDLYEALKSAELLAERAAQDRLEALAPAAADLSVATRLADAEANLALYLGPGAPLETAAPLRLALAQTP
jgi:uncharacterized protein (TIGR02444 family)